MAIVLAPPEWRKKKSLRNRVRDPLYAVGRAIRDAAVLTRRWMRDQWQWEAVAIISFAAIWLLAGPDPDEGDPAKIVTALVIPTSVFVGVAILVFLVLLLWTPFSDHRKVVWERDDAREKAAVLPALELERNQLAAKTDELEAENQTLKSEVTDLKSEVDHLSTELSSIAQLERLGARVLSRVGDELERGDLEEGRAIFESQLSNLLDKTDIPEARAPIEELLEKGKYAQTVEDLRGLAAQAPGVVETAIAAIRKRWTT